MPLDGEVSALSVLILGVSLGMTACAVTCMPFIGTWAIGRAEGQQGGFRDTASFLLGRLSAYSVLGGIAGALGAWFVQQLASGIGNLAIGLVAVVSAAWLMWPVSGKKSCGAPRHLKGLSPFLMGAGLTLIPCAPLTTLLAAAAAGGSVERGAFLGFLFGTGALLTPMLVMIPVAAGFGRYLRFERPWIVPWLRTGAAVVLLTLGYARINAVADGLFPYLLSLTMVMVGWAYYRHGRYSSRRVCTAGAVPVAGSIDKVKLIQLMRISP
jgi:thiol:disulfide interchange protein DsbD